MAEQGEARVAGQPGWAAGPQEERGARSERILMLAGKVTPPPWLESSVRGSIPQKHSCTCYQATQVCCALRMDAAGNMNEPQVYMIRVS